MPERRDLPPVIICCGMQRSGSTWQFLIASDLVESAGLGRRAGYLYRLEDVVGPDGASSTGGERVVVKSHDWHPELAELLKSRQALALYAYRDIREVAYSWAWKLACSVKHVLANKQLQPMLDNYYRWTGLPGVLVQPYHLIVNDPGRAIREIAGHLGLTAGESQVLDLSQKYSRDANRERAQQQETTLRGQGVDLLHPENALIEDGQTLLHWNHFRPGGALDWQSQSDLETIRELHAVTGRWLIEAGFEKNDLWVAKAIARWVVRRTRQKLASAYRRSTRAVGWLRGA